MVHLLVGFLILIFIFSLGNETSIADILKQTSDSVTQNSGYVFDQKTGLYFDSNSGYYYDPVRHLSPFNLSSARFRKTNSFSNPSGVSTIPTITKRRSIRTIRVFPRS